MEKRKTSSAPPESATQLLRTRDYNQLFLKRNQQCISPAAQHASPTNISNNSTAAAAASSASTHSSSSAFGLEIPPSPTTATEDLGCEMPYHVKWGKFPSHIFNGERKHFFESFVNN